MTGISEQNPYIGPRPIQQGERIYGRDEELQELFHLLQARRIVLLHSPSGAGKSSLVHAGLIPRLRAAHFDVWRPIRVNLDPSGLADVPDGTNRYVLSALLSLEEELPEARRRSPAALASMTLCEYLQGRPRRKGRQDQGVVLLFDQFEEILTAEPTAVEHKRQFCCQLGEALENGRYWALFIIREDYLGALAPYKTQIPTHLRNTFRLGLLGLEAAKQVAVESAKAGGRSFPAADVLIGDLSAISMQQPDGSFRAEQGLHVEPVQLQVVCRRLWDALPADALSIEQSDLEGRADVNEALAAYYAELVGRAAGGDLGDERKIREWVGTCLITGGIRSQVRRETGRSRGLDNALIERLQQSYLVRAEQRAGSLWYELSHDRLVEPIHRDNAAWEQQHLSPLQIQAKLWEQNGRADALLMGPVVLELATARAAEQPQGMTVGEQEFLDRSRRKRTRTALVAWVVGVLLVLAAGAAGVSYWQYGKAEANAAEAREAEALAVEQAARLHDKALISAAQGVPDDPTAQAALLREVQRPDVDRTWRRLAAGVASSTVAQRVLSHDAGVSSVVVSPSGEWLLTASSDGTARLWRTRDGQPLAVLMHGGPVNSAVFSPRGDRVITAADDGKARIWAVGAAGEAEGAPIVLEHGEVRVWRASSCADGTRVVTAAGNTARIWSADGEGAAVELPHDSGVTEAACSPAGADQVLTTAFSETKATLWAVEGGAARVARVLEHGAHVVRSASYSMDGTRVVTASHGSVRVWPTTGDGGPVVLEDDGQVNAAVFSPDGERVLTVSSHGHARIWPVGGSSEPLAELPVDRAAVGAAYSSDGAQVLVTTLHGTVYAWRADGRGAPFELQHDSMVASAVFSGDGTLAVTGATDGKARVWSLDARPIAFMHEGAVDAVSVVADGTLVVTASRDGTARIWSVDGLIDPVVLDHGRPMKIASAVAAPSGSMVVTAAEDQTMRIWRTKAPEQPVLQLSYDRSGAASAVFPGGGDVVVAASSEPSSPTVVKVWRIDGAGVSGPVALEIGREVAGVALSPDGRRAVVVSIAGDVGIWATEDGQASTTGLEPGQSIWKAMFSPDGRYIMALAMDDSARIWPADGAGEPVVLRHAHELTSATFSPDGETVLTTSTDWKAWLWRWSEHPDEPTALELDGSVDAGTFSASGKWAGTVSSRGTVWGWVVSDPKVVLSVEGVGASAVGFSPAQADIVVGLPTGEARMSRLRETSELADWLWSNTSYCLPEAERMVLLRESGEEAARRLAACRHEVDERTGG